MCRSRKEENAYIDPASAAAIQERPPRRIIQQTVRALATNEERNRKL